MTAITPAVDVPDQSNLKLQSKVHAGIVQRNDLLEDAETLAKIISTEAASETEYTSGITRLRVTSVPGDLA